MNINKHLIEATRTIKDAIYAINELVDEPLNLFVEENNRVLGSVTDGDIRRCILAGSLLDAPVRDAMHPDFKYLKAGCIDASAIRSLKKSSIKLIPVLNEKMECVDLIDLDKYKSFLPIDAVLMAGGKGERLRPLTEDTPKPLLKVGDKAIIDYNIERLISYGVRHLSVTVNYLKEQLEKHFAEPKQGIQVHTVCEPRFLGTIGSIQFVQNFYNDTVLIMNSDLFTNIDYEDFYLHFKEHDADMSIAAVPYTISVPYGIFELEGREVKGVLEKPTYNYYANAGIYLIKRELLNFIPDDKFFNATDFMEILMQKGYKVIRFPLNGTWIDIGNPQEYQKAKEFVKHMKG